MTIPTGYPGPNGQFPGQNPQGAPYAQPQYVQQPQYAQPQYAQAIPAQPPFFTMASPYTTPRNRLVLAVLGGVGALLVLMSFVLPFYKVTHPLSSYSLSYGMTTDSSSLAAMGGLNVVMLVFFLLAVAGIVSLLFVGTRVPFKGMLSVPIGASVIALFLFVLAVVHASGSDNDTLGDLETVQHVARGQYVGNSAVDLGHGPGFVFLWLTFLLFAGFAGFGFYCFKAAFGGQGVGGAVFAQQPAQVFAQPGMQPGPQYVAAPQVASAPGVGPVTGQYSVVPQVGSAPGVGPVTGQYPVIPQAGSAPGVGPVTGQYDVPPQAGSAPGVGQQFPPYQAPGV